MTTYKWNGKEFVSKKTGEPMDKPFAGQICSPMVVPDTPEYTSPIDGRLISGRVQRREDLKRNNCVEYEPTSNAPNLELARVSSAKRQIERKKEKQLDR